MTRTVSLIFVNTQNFTSAERLRAMQRVKFNWFLTGIYQRSIKKKRWKSKNNLNCPISFYNLLEWHLRISTVATLAVHRQIDGGE